MRIFRITSICVLLFVGAWVLWTNSSSFRETIQSYVENGEFLTLEARFSPEQIMESNRSELLPDNSYAFLQPSLKFHPYLLMEVKYTLPNGKTREGVMLWSMVDGEMVIDTENWEKTHGFEDTINAGASRGDFLVINALAKYRGALPLPRLQKELGVDDAEMSRLLESSKQKYLVIEKGSEVALHFQNPNFNVPPQTRINQWLVTKPYNHAQRVHEKYSARQIERTAKAAFGTDFAVRDSKVVFLPVYNIEVQNTYGTILPTLWNALNGKRIDTKYLAFVF